MKSENEKILFKNKWIEIYEKDDWYTCYRSKHGVAVLGFRMMESEPEILVRLENTPCHDDGPRIENLNMTSLTGMIEDDLNAVHTAKRELLEESGYDVPVDELKFLGWVYPSKMSDNKIYLFAVDLGQHVPVSAPKGDGSQGEDGGRCIWVSMKVALQLPSPIISACIAKLMIEAL